MKNRIETLGSGTVVLLLVFGLVLMIVHPQSESTESSSRFWSTTKKGANFFNQIPAEERFQAASELGLEYIRLVPDKWASEERDFLLGSADRFTGLVEEDLKRLKQVLEWADRWDCRIVLGMLNLPGARWVQQNNGKQDYRLWNSEDYQNQAAHFWRELAGQLKDHPAIVAYNPLNEPHPARQEGIDDADDSRLKDWLEKKRGTPGDLNRFYSKICGAIREVDPNTPILVEGYGHGSVHGLTYLNPIDDPHILYSFHFYEPWIYTTRRVNQGRYAYPERMPKYWDGPAEPWTIDSLREKLNPVETWRKKHRISNNRIVAAEFGCSRKVEGATEYLRDVIRILNEKGYHWAFYSYREDVWDEMDYELGTEMQSGGGWFQFEQGKYRKKRWQDNPLWQVFKREFGQ